MAMAKVLFLVLISLVALEQILVDATFSSNMNCTWGYDNCRIKGDTTQLILNKWSGAAIQGNNQFLYGYIDMRIKLVPGNAAAVVTTYYTSSEWKSKDNDNHDEIDFEFLGNVTGPNNYYTLHTNIFVNGVGNREQQFRMNWYNPTSDYHNYTIFWNPYMVAEQQFRMNWYNPTSDYHNYTIFWNPYMVAWSVDRVIIRVFKNYEDQGIPFPKNKPQRAYTSIWNADDWACQGGRVKTNWTYQPFVANYQNYMERACIYTGTNSAKDCSNPSNWYFNAQYKQLSQAQRDSMNKIRNQYMVYNYCTDTRRFNGKLPPECSKPQY